MLEYIKEQHRLIEVERRKLEKATVWMGSILFMGENHQKAAEDMKAFRKLLRFDNAYRIENAYRLRDWKGLLSELAVAEERLEKIRQIGPNVPPSVQWNRLIAWNEQKARYLSCAETLYQYLSRVASACSRGICDYHDGPPETSAVVRPKQPTAIDSDTKEASGDVGGAEYVEFCVNDMPSFDWSDHSEIIQPEAQPVNMDQVFFTAVAPKEFRRDEYTDVTVVMYEDAYRHIVDRIRENYDGQVTEQGSGAVEVAKRTPIRVTIESQEAGICFDNTEETGVWIGKSLEFHFWVMVPETFQKKQFKLTIRVYTDDIPSTTLTLFVKCDAPSTQEITPERRDIRSVFVSYARADTEEVTMLIRGMEKVRPDLNVFMDQESLRSGQNWQEVLKAEIERRDMLFLCWSLDAKASEWVDFEWRHMYNKRGIEHIDPIPLISPQSCPPPEELSMLHFDDRWLHYRKRQEPVGPDGFYIRNNKTDTIMPIRKSSILIGREKDADLRLDAYNVSRHHMMIEVMRNGDFRVRDLDSTNGSFIEGEQTRITPDGVIVKRGTKLRLANEIIEIL